MTHSFEQFAAVRLLASARYSPDGTSVAYLSDVTGYANLWLMPDRGGFARQLTGPQRTTGHRFPVPEGGGAGRR